MNIEQALLNLKRQKSTFLNIFSLLYLSDDEFYSLVDEAGRKANTAAEVGDVNEVDLVVILFQILMDINNKKCR
jgi:hypothetical protein